MDTSPDDARQRQRHDWSTAAPGWVARSRNRTAPDVVSEQLVEMAGIGTGECVLDLACGTGNPTFLIAERVGPEGFVLGLDITPRMIDAAREEAGRRGTDNIEFRTVESELELGVPDAGFDAAVSRFGLPFMPEPVAVLEGLARAVKPSRRVAIATWGPVERVPMFAATNAIISRHVDLPPRDPHALGPTSLPFPDILSTLFNEAGLEDVEIAIVDYIANEAPDPASFWDEWSRAAGPIVGLLDSLSEEQRLAIREDAIRTFSEMFPEGPVRIGGEVLVAAGIRPN